MGTSLGLSPARTVIVCATAMMLCASHPLQAYTYNPDNNAAIALLCMGGSARGLAMGGAYAALACGAEASYWNPGGLAYQGSRIELLLSPRVFRSEEYELGDDDRSYLMAQGGYRWRHMAFALGFLHHRIGGILYNDGSTTEVRDDEIFSNSQTGLIAAAGVTILRDHLGVGISFRRVSNSFNDLPVATGQWSSETSGGGWSIQGGLTYRVSEDLAAAAVIDLPSEIDWGLAQGDESASRIQTAASYRFLRSSTLEATAAAQLENVGRSWARLHLGGEVVAFHTVAIRVGYKNLHLVAAHLEVDDLNEAGALTAGIGSTDVHLFQKYDVQVDLAADWQDFNRQVVASFRLGF